jgi:hypothetical protein
MNSSFRSVILSGVSLAALAAGAPSAVAANCESLKNLSLPGTTISLAQSYAAGQVITGTTAAPVDLCRVVGKIAPSTDSNINFEVWMPSSNWTGRYEQVGNGGFAGSIVYGALQAAVANNNATASTDDGSSQPPGTPGGFFALGHPERIKDYGFRAVHLTNVNSKAIVQSFYGKRAKHSYFNGCSKGGQESLMEAQRFPDDFDGILGGAAASDWIPLFSGFVWGAQKIADASAGFVPSANLPALAAAASTQCSKAKLLSTDSFFNDPRDCHFNAQALLCKGTPDSSCLTQPQIDAVNAVLDGPRTASGEQVAVGYEPEFPLWAGIITQANPTPPGATIQGFFGVGFYTNFITPPMPLNGPGAFDVNTSPEEADEQQGATMNSYNPDISKFRRHGGKLIQYHGWADPLVSPRFSVDYFQKVVAFNEKHGRDRGDGALRDTQDFFRLFMAPGMSHCGGGPGLNSFGQNGGSGPAASDIFSALEKWVEEDVAPEKIIATGGAPPNTFTRPLCPFPERAVFVGGDPANAASFACSHDRDEDDHARGGGDGDDRGRDHSDR